MAMAMRVVSPSAVLLSLPGPISRTESFRVDHFGSRTKFPTLPSRATAELSRARIRVRVKSLSGEESSGVEDDAAVWLREELPLELEKDGVDSEKMKRIAEACADACANFLATGRTFDPVMIMDAMEEEIERRDLRGDDFLPFELGRKAAKVLTQRWNELPVTERPKTYCQQANVNKKDVVDFDKWPKNLNFLDFCSRRFIAKALPFLVVSTLALQPIQARQVRDAIFICLCSRGIELGSSARDWMSIQDNSSDIYSSGHFSLKSRKPHRIAI